jgi:hypothetical protein
MEYTKVGAGGPSAHAQPPADNAAPSPGKRNTGHTRRMLTCLRRQRRRIAAATHTTGAFCWPGPEGAHAPTPRPLPTPGLVDLAGRLIFPAGHSWPSCPQSSTTGAHLPARRSEPRSCVPRGQHTGSGEWQSTLATGGPIPKTRRLLSGVAPSGKAVLQNSLSRHFWPAGRTLTPGPGQGRQAPPSGILRARQQAGAGARLVS